MLIVHLEHDHDLKCPTIYNDWKLHSFSRKHASYTDPEELGLSYETDSDGTPIIRNPGLRRKLQVGLAHWLSYFEHGQCWWGRRDGEIPGGVEFRWDGARIAGLLIWQGKPNEVGKTFEERAANADGFLKAYTSWANGEGWYFRIEDEDENDLDSCGGFDDADYMLKEYVAPQLVGKEFRVVGDADYLEDKLRELVKSLEKTTVAPSR